MLVREIQIHFNMESQNLSSPTSSNPNILSLIIRSPPDTAARVTAKRALLQDNSNTPDSKKQRPYCEIKTCKKNRSNVVCHNCKKFACGTCIYKTIFICKNCETITNSNENN